MQDFLKDYIKNGKIVNSNEMIKQIVELAYKSQIIAIDTEFTREKTYYPILSLIQIAVDKKVFAVDCLSGADLGDIYKILRDPKIKKIFHSCSQDLQIFHQKTNQAPHNVTDIQLMSNFCGVGYNVGYSALVEKFMGIQIDKKLQKSNWQRRPLDEEQIQYALLDVLYLEEIHAKLFEILHEKKREEWFLEEMNSFTSRVLSSFDDNLYKNFSGQRKFGRKNVKQKTKIKNLILWREKMAKVIDIPRQHFLSDRVIEEIVMEENFDNINFQSLNFQGVLDYDMIDKIREIITEIDRDNIEVDLQERSSIMNESQKSKFHQAKNIIADVARQEDLKEQFLVTSQVLKDIVLENNKVDEKVSGWRYSLFGHKLEKIIY